VPACILRREEPAKFLVVDDADIKATRVVAVGKHCSNGTMSKAVIGVIVIFETVATGENAAAVGRKKHTLRVTRIDEYVVYGDIGGGTQLPLRTAINGLPQACGGSRINHHRLPGVLLQHSGAYSRVRDAFNTRE